MAEVTTVFDFLVVDSVVNSIVNTVVVSENEQVNLVLSTDTTNLCTTTELTTVTTEDGM